MNRKRMSFCLLVFLLFSTVASAQQSVTKADIKVLETKIASLKNTVKDIDKCLTAQIQAISQIQTMFSPILTLIAITLAIIVITLPQLLGYLEKRKCANLRKQIEELEKRVKQQQRKIEELRRKLVMPS